MGDDDASRRVGVAPDTFIATHARKKKFITFMGRSFVTAAAAVFSTPHTSPGGGVFFWLRHPAAISRDFWVVLRMLVFLPPSLRYTQYSLEGWVTQRVGMKERRRSPFHPLNGAGAIFFLTFPSSFDERTHKEERNIAYDK